MFETLKDGVDGLRSQFSRGTAGEATLERDAEHSEAEGLEDPEGGRRVPLFQCPECETVYLATEKETCSNCGSAVEQVSPRSKRA